MNYRNAFETIMKEKGINQTELASKAGMRNQSNISEAFKRDMKISLVCKIANALGYDVVLVSQSKRGRKTEGALYIEDVPYIGKRGDDK